MQKAEFELNLSRSSSGRARSCGLRSPHSKRLGSLNRQSVASGGFMQTLTFVPALLPAAPAVPGPALPSRRRASRARLRRQRNGESFKFGCKATGNRVHPPLRYGKIHLIVTGFSLRLSLFLSLSLHSRHASHAASGGAPYTRH